MLEPELRSLPLAARTILVDPLVERAVAAPRHVDSLVIRSRHGNPWIAAAYTAWSEFAYSEGCLVDRPGAIFIVQVGS